MKKKIPFLIAGIVLILAYQITDHIPGASAWAYENIAHPYHLAVSGLCDKTAASVAELLILVGIILFAAYLIAVLVYIIQNRSVKVPLLNFLITCVMLFGLIYGAFCVLWGFYYAAPGVYEVCGVSPDPEGIDHEDLIAVDEYFLDLANEYSEKVSRTDDGLYEYPYGGADAVFDYSAHLYDAISVKYPLLKEEARRPKPIAFSRVMSYMDFSGFFSPFTGEACINADSPAALTPSVIAHELAHLRGIGAEDEANFIAVITCLEDGDPDYVYSASLMALSYLQGALYESGDTENLERIKDGYAPGVSADLKESSRYWGRYRDSFANRISTDIYDRFLKSYDQEKGRETYNDCVNLLVEYYR